LSDPIHAVVRYHSLRALASLGRMTFARLRDLLDAAKLVFASCAGVAAFAALGYLPATGFWPLLAITLLQASALASLAPLGDVLILATAAPPVNGKGPGFDYGCYAEPGRAPSSPAPSCRARLSSATASLYRRATGIGFETEDVLVKFLHGIELRRFRVDPDSMMVDFENTNAHRRPPRG
jgi:hypothetical protein